MKRFLSLSLLFFGLLTVFVIAQALPTYYILNNKPYTFPEQIRTVVIGDSHNECAIDDQYFSSLKNWSKSGESYVSSYAKLRKVFETENYIDTIILGVSPNHINPNSDNRWIWNNATVNQFMYVWAFDEFKQVGLHSDIFRWLNIINWKEIYTDAHITNSMGRCLPIEETALQKSIARFEQLLGTDSVFYGNEVELTYLDKIVKLCLDKDIKLIFLSTPIYQADRFFDTRYFYNFLQEKYYSIEFWDYTNFSLPDSCFADVHHLNKWGAEKFSKYLIDNKFILPKCVN